jgi:endonuclease YncB( thermonuclease family)
VIAAIWSYDPLGLGDTPSFISRSDANVETGIPGSSLIIVDGDTVRYRGDRLRLLDIDAPETSEPRCPAERQAGYAATTALRTLIAGQRVDIRYSGSIDRYGRPLVRLATADGDVGAALVARGLALPYAGGRVAYDQRKAHWCGWG